MMNYARFTVVVLCIMIASAFAAAVGGEDNEGTDKNGGTRSSTLYVGAGQMYTSIQAAVDAASAGDTIRVYAGTYIESGLLISKKTSLIGNGSADTTIKMASGGGGSSPYQIELGCSGSLVYGFKVADTVIFINENNSNIIKECELDGGYIRIYYSMDNTIRDCVITNNEYAGIEIETSNNNYIINCTISINHPDSVYVYGVTADHSESNTVQGCNISSSMYGIDISADSGSGGNLIEDNTITARGARGAADISMWGALDVIMYNNTMKGGGVYIRGSDISNWDSHKIPMNNTLNGNPVYYCTKTSDIDVPSNAAQVIIADCSDIRVFDYRFEDIACPIEAGFSDNILISNVSATNGTWGIYLENTDHCNISNCHITYCNYGIFLWHSSYNDVYRCNSSENNIGISMLYSWSAESKYNKILSSIFYMNVNRGLEIQDSDLSSVQQNTFILNNLGIWVSGKSNSIHHNYFYQTGSFTQVADSGSNNKWDDGSQGNYWSDWQTPDSNSDGIVDLPYAIPGSAGSKDNYPLVYPANGPTTNRTSNGLVVNTRTNEHYLQIQKAIDAASAGDTIRVYDGTYNEQLDVDKSLWIIGNSTSSVIRYNNDHVVKISADDCVFSGFNISLGGSTSTVTGIMVVSDNNRLDNLTITVGSNESIYSNRGIILTDSSGNEIMDSNIIGAHDVLEWDYSYGILLQSGSNENLIQRNRLFNIARAIELNTDCCNNLFIYNNITGSERNGCGLMLIQNCNDNMIENNFLFVDLGIGTYSNCRNTVISNNTLNGARIWIEPGCEHTLIKDNILLGSRVDCMGLESITITNNRIDNRIFQHYIGIYLDNVNNAVLRNNKMYNGGLFIRSWNLSGWRLCGWLTADIDETNMLNDRPILFLRNEKNIAIDNDYGQVILANCSDIVIGGLNIDNAFCGIQMVYSSGIEINGNQIDYTCYSIQVASSSGIEIKNNLIGVAEASAIDSDQMDNSTIMNNTIHDTERGVVIEAGNDNIISGNRFDNITDDGVHLSGGLGIVPSNRNIISKNRINNATYAGIDVNYPSEYNRILNNEITNISGMGILVGDMRYMGFRSMMGTPNIAMNELSGNILKNNGIGLVANCMGNSKISSNTFNANKICGMYVTNSYNNTIDNNLFKNNGGYGLNIGGFEVMSNNSDWALINFFEPYNDTIINYLYNSTDNTIINNTFISNKCSDSQAYDDGTENIWDNGIGGNYWDDWTSPDANGDGIVDLPYAISGTAGAKDRFPLTTPSIIVDIEPEDDDTNVSDTDLDTLPDSWELEHFGNMTQGPGDDPDGDGLTNFEEWKNGTDPLVADDTTDDTSAFERYWDEWGLLTLALTMVALAVLVLVVAVVIMRRRASRDENTHAEESRVNGESDANVLEFGDDIEAIEVAEEADAVPEGDTAMKALREYEQVSEVLQQPDELDSYIIEVEEKALDPETGPHDEDALKALRADLEKQHENGKIGEDTYKEMKTALDEI